MSHKNQPLPTSSSLHKKSSDRNSIAKTQAGPSQGKRLTETTEKNLVVAPDGSMFVKTLVQIDPDRDLFMRVAQSAYADHERSLVQCAKCNRKFFPDRIGKHQSNCAAEKWLPPHDPKSQQSRQKK